MYIQHPLLKGMSNETRQSLDRTASVCSGWCVIATSSHRQECPGYLPDSCGSLGPEAPGDFVQPSSGFRAQRARVIPANCAEGGRTLEKTCLSTCMLFTFTLLMSFFIHIIRWTPPWAGLGPIGVAFLPEHRSTLS